MQNCLSERLNICCSYNPAQAKQGNSASLPHSFSTQLKNLFSLYHSKITFALLLQPLKETL